MRKCRHLERPQAGPPPPCMPRSVTRHWYYSAYVGQRKSSHCLGPRRDPPAPGLFMHSRSSPPTLSSPARPAGRLHQRGLCNPNPCCCVAKGPGCCSCQQRRGRAGTTSLASPNKRGLGVRKNIARGGQHCSSLPPHAAVGAFVRTQHEAWPSQKLVMSDRTGLNLRASLLLPPSPGLRLDVL